MGLIRELDRAQAYFSIFESNSLEFEGPDLTGTVAAIESPMGQDVLKALNVALLPEVLRQDERAFKAIGLETARVLASRFVGGPDRRGISEADVRSLHGVVMAGSWHAGDYKKFDVGIEGSDHTPVDTIRIGFAMRELSDWTQQSFDDDSSILRAAIGHAWFTHLHPFQDGNGRVARLVTNVMLGQDGLPPAIVKAKAQRSKYIAALAHSDEGGDIMPLTGLFLDTVERYVAELQRPRTFKRLFDDLVARRGDTFYEWYSRCLTEFIGSLLVEFSLQRLEYTPLDHLTKEAFENLRNGGREAVYLGVVTNSSGQEVLLYFRRPSQSAARTDPETVPEIAFAVPNAMWSLSPYRRIARADLDGLSSVRVVPDIPIGAFVDGANGVRRVAVKDAASTVADELSKAMRRGFEVPNRYFGSARWMPKLNGGPG